MMEQQEQPYSIIEEGGEAVKSDKNDKSDNNNVPGEVSVDELELLRKLEEANRSVQDDKLFYNDVDTGWFKVIGGLYEACMKKLSDFESLSTYPLVTHAGRFSFRYYYPA